MLENFGAGANARLPPLVASLRLVPLALNWFLPWLFYWHWTCLWHHC